MINGSKDSFFTTDYTDFHRLFIGIAILSCLLYTSESLTPQAIAARESEENGAITLEGKLIDGGEFTLRALDFRRMEFGNKPTGTPDATISFHTCLLYTSRCV